MNEEPPQQLTGEFPSDALGEDKGMASVFGYEGEPNQRPLQLPRVGWGNDSDEDDANNAQRPTETPIPIPEIKHDDSDVVVIREYSRNSEGELASIPEDISMHGAWPDYYPDMLGCYDYYEHDRRKYKRWGQNFKRRLCVVIILVFAAVIVSEISAKTPRNQRHQSRPSSNSDSDAAPVNLENDDTSDQSEYPPNVDLYETIVDTFQPIMCDDSTQWDGSFFHAFEFCGAVYNRVPCPYIAYCPFGPGTAPLGGTKIGTKESWAPIFNSMGKGENSHPDWVQLGTDGTCDLYSKIHGGSQPPWGNVPAVNDTEDISRHVMCCLEATDGIFENGKDGPPNDPYYLDRPPALEEDELEKPIPMREEEGESENNSDSNHGTRTLSSNALERRKIKHNNDARANNFGDGV